MVNKHTLDSKLTFEKRPGSIEQMFHPSVRASPSQSQAHNLKDASMQQHSQLNPQNSQAFEMPTESEQGSSYYDEKSLAGQQHQLHQHSFSGTSAAMDSSEPLRGMADSTAYGHRGEAYGKGYGQQVASLEDMASGSIGATPALHNAPTFNHNAAMGESADFMAQVIVNKKSDWTMDMPKIEYQPDNDDDDEYSESATGKDGDAELEGKEFLSDESDDDEANGVSSQQALTVPVHH